MFFQNDRQTVKEQQYRTLSELCSVFKNYKHLFHAVIPTTSVSTLVAQLETILKSNHSELKVGVLFQSLDYEALFKSTNVADTRKVECLLRAHQKLKVPVNGAKSRMSFLALLDAAKKAMEAETLDRDTAEDIRYIIQQQRDLLTPQTQSDHFYGARCEAQPLQKPQNKQLQEIENSYQSQPTITSQHATAPKLDAYITEEASNLFILGLVSDALLKGVTQAITAAPEPSISGYMTLN